MVLFPLPLGEVPQVAKFLPPFTLFQLLRRALLVSERPRRLSNRPFLFFFPSSPPLIRFVSFLLLYQFELWEEQAILALLALHSESTRPEDYSEGYLSHSQTL